MAWNFTNFVTHTFGDAAPEVVAHLGTAAMVANSSGQTSNWDPASVAASAVGLLPLAVVGEIAAVALDPQTAELALDLISALKTRQKALDNAMNGDLPPPSPSAPREGNTLFRVHRIDYYAVSDYPGHFSLGGNSLFFYKYIDPYTLYSLTITGPSVPFPDNAGSYLDWVDSYIQSGPPLTGQGVVFVDEAEVDVAIGALKNAPTYTMAAVVSSDDADAWTSYDTTIDASFNVLKQDVTWKNGDNSSITFDPGGSNASQWIAIRSDAEGHLLREWSRLDSGETYYWEIDRLGTEEWEQYAEVYDTQGNLSRQYVKWDDNTSSFYASNNVGVEPWLWTWETYASNGDTLWSLTRWNNGQITFYNHNDVNVGPWTSYVRQIDANGHILYSIYGDAALKLTAFGSNGDDTLFGLGAGATLLGNDGNDIVTGSDEADSLDGGNGDDTLNGMAGNDTMTGGLGNDRYTVNDAGDQVIENLSEGNDTVFTTLPAYTLTANVEDLFFEGVGNFTGVGNALDNAITGGAGNDLLDGVDGNDTLDGAGGGDTMAGGLGDDRYLVNDASDQVVENLSEGNDTVFTTLAVYTLAANVEDLLFDSVGNFTGVGNGLDNVITGGAGNDLLDGSDGNDTMDGAGGGDTMVGGVGGDTYIVDSPSDFTTENPGEGTDTVRTALASYTLQANIENAERLGGGDFTLFGNALDNYLSGGIGNDLLLGQGGNDTVLGGEGNDTITGRGRLEGGAGEDCVTGLAGDDVLLGGDGDDSLRGAGGSDHLDGGAGTNYAYYAGSRSHYTIAYTGKNIDGVDTFRIADTSAAPSDADTLTNVQFAVFDDAIVALDTNSVGIIFNGGTDPDTLIGDIGPDTLEGFGGNDSISGLGGADSLIGDNGDDTILGGDGNDTLDGGDGADSMAGGAGDDLYIVSNPGDVVVELPGEGSDTLQAEQNAYTLPGNVEALVFFGVGNFSGMGNASANTLTGGTGNDTLDGLAGADRLIGGAGDDTYEIDNAGDAVTENPGGGTDTVRSSLLSISAASFANVERLIYTGAGDALLTGDALANHLTGSTGSDTLDGGAGADTMVGLGGNDAYYVDHADDLVTEAPGGGSDSVYTTLHSYTLTDNVEALFANGDANPYTLTGNAEANSISGGSGADSLDGAGGADQMAGGLGDDTYRVDTASDQVTEAAAAGFDTVLTALASRTLETNVEALTYTGAGNFSGTGNAGNNSLTGGAGADTLNGLGGTDTLAGLGGSDRYFVDEAADQVVEASSAGSDSIYASSGSYTLSDNVETLFKSGPGAFAGTGNALDNLLAGGTGNDTLDGAGGGDTMVGGLGDDTYGVDSASDFAAENPGEGTDTVRTTLISYTLSSALENVAYTGAGNFTGFGNAAANMLTGGTGNDFLLGQGGNDTMAGGLGNDRYMVNDAGDQVVENLGEGNDTVFTTLATLTLAANADALTFDSVGSFTGRGNEIDNAITGGASNDLLIGFAGNDTLTGGGGADTMIGGLGDDTYIVDNSSDFAPENPGEGTDTVRTALLSYTLQANIENAERIGGGDFTVFGNVLDNRLSGGIGDDFLLGQGGADTMLGGNGNDRYMVIDAGDQVVEGVGEGNDTVYTSLLTYALAANIETVIYDGTGNFSATGTTGANVLFGGSGSDTLDGGDGNDTLNGLSGADSLNGGLGLDTFIVTGAQLAGSGMSINGGVEWDSLVFAGNVTGGIDDNFANMTGLDVMLFTGTDAQSITLGDAAGLAYGGAIFAYAPVATSVSIDVSAMTTGRLTAFGTANADTIIGGALNDIIIGNGGADSLSGGAGNDNFTLTTANLAAPGLRIDGGTGFDTLLVNGNLVGTADTQFTDFANLEEIRIVGFGAQSMTLASKAAAAFNGTISVQSPNASSLSIDGSGLVTARLTAFGTASADTLTGGDLNDTLFGSGGADSLTGGGGNDQFVIAGSQLIAGTTGIAAGAGSDLLILQGNFNSPVAMSFIGMSGLETLMLAGTGAQSLVLGANAGTAFGGNVFAYAPSAASVNLDASAMTTGRITGIGTPGADTLAGGTGNDLFTGAAGADLFNVGFGQDVISDFLPGLDRISLQTGGFVDFASLSPSISNVGGSAVIDLGAGNKVTLTGVLKASLSGGDFGLL